MMVLYDKGDADIKLCATLEHMVGNISYARLLGQAGPMGSTA